MNVVFWLLLACTAMFGASEPCGSIKLEAAQRQLSPPPYLPTLYSISFSCMGEALNTKTTNLNYTGAKGKIVLLDDMGEAKISLNCNKKAYQLRLGHTNGITFSNPDMKLSVLPINTK